MRTSADMTSSNRLKGEWRSHLVGVRRGPLYIWSRMQQLDVNVELQQLQLGGAELDQTSIHLLWLWKQTPMKGDRHGSRH